MLLYKTCYIIHYITTLLCVCPLLDLRGEDDGDRIVEDTLSKQQGVQVHVHPQLVEDSQHRHCQGWRGQIKSS